MIVVSVESIDYRIFGDGTAIIQSRNNSVKAILIPYSIHTISSCPRTDPMKFESLVFEFESELRSIGGESFYRSSLRSLFLPPTVHFIGEDAFKGCSSIACVHFEPQSFLG
jgi:hypothetical protein